MKTFSTNFFEKDNFLVSRSEYKYSNLEDKKRIYHICYNCHWDLTNYAINPSTIDYCRSVKEDSIENLKKKTTVFNYE